MKKVITLNIILLLSCCNYLLAQINRVVISEIMYDTPLNEKIASSISYSNGEYIKLSNVGNTTADISRWQLIGGGKTEVLHFEEGTSIPPRGHLIVAYQHKDKFTDELFTLDKLYTNLHPFGPNEQVIYQRKIILSNSGEAVVLKNTYGHVIDSIYYDGTSNKTKPNRLEAFNWDGRDGWQCVSLQRLTVEYNGTRAITDNTHWIVGKAAPLKFHEAFTFPNSTIIDNNFNIEYNFLVTRTYSDKNTYSDEIQYYDALGRPNQKIRRKYTPKEQDLVFIQEYDELGREKARWLPTTSIGNGDYIYNYEADKKIKLLYKDNKPYISKSYDNFPSNNPTEIFNPGENWYKNFRSYKTNLLTNDKKTNTCLRFEFENNRIVSKGYYSDGELFVLESINEDNNITYEFKDKQDVLVLSRRINDGEKLDTYYIYDDFGNLIYVLPPLIISNLSSYLDDNSDLIQKYAYVYKYDEYNRCIMKRIPGCDWIHYIYDSGDKIIFSQDGEQRSQNKATFYLYDKYNRNVVDGVCSYPSQTEINYLNDHSIFVTPVYSMSNYPSNYDLDIIKYHYLLYDFKIKFPEGMTCRYYDTYDVLNLIKYPKECTSYDMRKETDDDFEEMHRISEKGLLTVQTTSSYGVNGESLIVSYYDNFKRTVQKRMIHALGGADIEYYKYDLLGNLKKKLIEHNSSNCISTTSLNNNIDTKELYLYTYDHAGRITEVKHQLNDGLMVSIEKNEYDEFGRLSSKIKHNNQKLKTKYNYNIRSWLTNIFGPYLNQDIFYDRRINSLSKAYYSGNISSMTCQLGEIKKGEDDFYTRKRGYIYEYDNISQLTKAIFMEGNNDSGDAHYFDTDYEYDMHGNITYLHRNGTNIIGGDPVWLDDLELTYHGNQLKKVVDYGQPIESSISECFNDYANLDIEYEYNKNGSLIKDANKGITSIKYNVLNLPLSISIDNPLTKGKISYVYSADGVKLQVVHETDPISQDFPIVNTGIYLSNSTQKITTRYVKNKIYENGILKRILFNGGYIENNKYHYFLKDYLGNNRIVADADGIIKQQMHYYPFGLSFSENLGGETQPYKYNDKEYDKMYGLKLYDYSARYYDPTYGRFTTSDPLSERYYSKSPYVYCLNNPVKFIDPDGRSVFATDINAMRNISNTLSKEESQYVSFNADGMLDVSLLNRYEGSSDNFTALQVLANSETNYIFGVSNQDANGKVFFEKGDDPNNPNNFSYGITLMPGAENDPSPNNNVYIFTASFLDEKKQASNTAHEGYGHAYFYELSKSDSSINPNHTKGVVGTGYEYDPEFKINIPYAIFGNSNLQLEEQIKKVEEQAIENYEERNK